MITKFKITSAPQRANLTIDSSPFVLNQEYSITLQSTMVLTVTDRGVPYDTFKYQLGNEEGAWSPELIITVHAQVNAGIPSGTPFSLEHDIFEQVDLNPHFVFDDKTDRILFDAIDSNIGELFIDGNPAILGKTYMLYEFENVIYKANHTNQVPNAFGTLTFKNGNKDGYSTSYDVILTSRANLWGTINGQTIIATV